MGLRRPAGRDQGLLVPAEAVVEHGVGPLGPGYAETLAAQGYVAEGGGDERGRLGFDAAPRGDAHGGVRRRAAPGRLRGRANLEDHRRRAGQVAGEQEHECPGAEGERQLAERAHLAGETDVPIGEPHAAIVVAQMYRRRERQRQPAQLLVRGHAAAEGAQRPAQYRYPGRVPLGEVGGQAVEKEIGRTGRTRRRGRRAGRARHRQQIGTGAGQPAGEERGHQRIEVGRPGETGVDRPEPAGGPQQQRRSVAAPAGDERELGPGEIDPGALERPERPGFRHDQQVDGRGERARVHLGLRRGQRPPRAPGRIRGQHGRALQERRGRGQPAARLRPPGRALKLGRHVLAGLRCRLGPVPGPAVRIGLRIGDLRQSRVSSLPVPERRRPVGRRAHQRMPEPHLPAELHQPRMRGRLTRVRRDRQPAGSLPHQRGIAGRIGRRQLQQPPRLARQGSHLPAEALLDRAGQRHRAGQPEPARQLLG